jgi:hypothetical protein
VRRKGNEQPLEVLLLRPTIALDQLRGRQDVARSALIERQGDRYGARWVSPVAIFGCAGARDDAAAAALAEALKRGGVERVRHLQRRPPLPSDDVWLRGADWCLTCEEE